MLRSAIGARASSRQRIARPFSRFLLLPLNGKTLERTDNHSAMLFGSNVSFLLPRATSKHSLPAQSSLPFSTSSTMLYHTLFSSLRANIINRTYSKGLSEPSKSFPTFEAQGPFRTQRYPPPLTSTSVPPSYRHSNPRQSTSPKRGQPFRPPFEVVSPFRTSFELPSNFEVTSKLEFHFELLRIRSNRFDTPFSNPFNLSTIHPSTLLHLSPLP